VIATEVQTELSRWIFGLSASFHFLFVPLSIGLLVCINLLQTAHAISRRPSLEAAATFWSRLFLLTWATGIATGYPLRWQLTELWERYLHVAKPVFSAVFEIEGLLLWPMVGLVLALTLGRQWLHPLLRALLGWVLLGVLCTQSLTILSINAWMQVPQMLPVGPDGAPLPHLPTLLLHPTTLHKTWHTLSAAMLCGAFFVFALSAGLMRQGRELPLARVSVGAAVWVGLLGALSVMLSGHESVLGVADRQPMKFAAFEGHWRAEPHAAPLVLWAKIDAQRGVNHHAVEIPYVMSLLRDLSLKSPPGVHDVGQQWGEQFLRDSVFDTLSQNVGLARMAQVLEQRHGAAWHSMGTEARAQALAQAMQPPVRPLFYLFRLMVFSGVVTCLLCVLAFWQRKRLRAGRRPWLMGCLAWCAPLPWVATLSGWAVAEMGRQPWVVYGILPTGMASGPAGHGVGVADLLQLFASGLLIALVYAWASHSVWAAGSTRPHWLDTRHPALRLVRWPHTIVQAWGRRKRAG